jgi:hypothetical protein
LTEDFTAICNEIGIEVPEEWLHASMTDDGVLQRAAHPEEVLTGYLGDEEEPE